MSVAVVGLHLGGALLTRHHAESAADLAALAGAAGVVAGEPHACAQARRVTDRMKVRLVFCQTRGEDLLVQVAIRPRGPLGRLGSGTGRARAGPVAPGPPASLHSTEGSTSWCRDRVVTDPGCRQVRE